MLRRPRPLAKRLEALLARSVPGIVMVLGVSADSAAALAAAKSLDQPTCLWFQSNADLEERLFVDSTFQNAYGVTAADARSCLQNADLLIAQTDRQRELLRQTA